MRSENPGTGHYHDEFKCRLFPSIAVRPQKDLGLPIRDTTREAVEIESDGGKYLIGEGSTTGAAPNLARILDDEFSRSSIYMALVRGALYFMEQPKIDVLVLGLPLTTYRTHHEELRKRITGGHTLPNWRKKRNPGSPDHVSVEVANVRILPQPVGAFYNYCIPRGLYDQVSAQRNLILDVGHGTFDWLVAEGTAAAGDRSDGYPGGVSKIITKVAEAIGHGKNNFNILADIDKALRGDGLVFVRGKEHNVLKDHRKLIDDTIRDAVSAMLDNVRDTDDIHNIILTGGGAKLFLPVLQTAIPHRSITVEANPIYCNVCGFQMAGEIWLRQMGA